MNAENEQSDILQPGTFHQDKSLIEQLSDSTESRKKRSDNLNKSWPSKAKQRNPSDNRQSELSGQIRFIKLDSIKQQKTKYQPNELLTQSSGRLGSISHSQPVSSNNTQIKNANIEEMIKARTLSINNRELLIAAGKGCVENVERLRLTEGVDVNFVDKDGNTALHYAVIKGNEEVVNYLLEYGADMYIEDNNNKSPFDIAVTYKKENVIRILGGKIVDESIEILNKSKFKKNTIQITEPNKTSNNEPGLVKEIGNTEKKIKDLLNCLEVYTANKDELSYKQANVFILFLEIFAFHNNPKQVNKLKDIFFKSEKETHAAIVNTRTLILKKRVDNQKKRIQLCDVQKIIESCYNDGKAAQNTSVSKVNSFFNKLKEYVKRKTSNRDNSHDDIKVCSFFKEFPNTPEKGNIGKSGTTTDPYNEFRNLVLKAYKKEENLDQCWFEFVVNIYPALDLEGKKDEEINDIEKQLRHLRNNLIHEFYRFGIQEFREAIINLRGKLFEYYYAKKVHSELKSLIPGKDIEEIKRNFNKELKDLQDKFEDSEEFLSEEEARSLFGYKFVKSLFPKESANSHDNTVRELVEEYFKYMSIVEDVNRVHQDDDREEEEEEEKDSECNKKLDDVARRELFERFIRLRRIKENFTDETYREQQKEFSDLQQYGVEPAKFNLVCKYYLEEGKYFNEEVSNIIENVVKFIECIIEIKESDSDYKEKDIVSLGEIILNKHTVDKKLVLGESSSIKNKLKEKAEKNYKIMQVFDQVESFTNVCMDIGGITLEIDVTQTVKNMLRTFYNAYNECKIEFDIEDIFSRESFLNELVWQDIKIRRTTQSSRGNAEHLDSNSFVIIYKLIDIEYMSPYIVKLIENRIKEGENVSQIIDKANLVKLLNSLLNKEEYVDYLNILLGIQVQSFNLYEELYDKILEKKMDIKKIRSVFKKFKHLEGFAGLLKPTSTSNEQQKNYIIKLTKSFLRIINEEAADRLYYIHDCNEALKILGKGNEIQERFKEVMEDDDLDFIDRDLLTVKIKNQQKKYDEALKILEVVKQKLESGGSINHKTKFLLTLSEIEYTKKLSNNSPNYDDLYNKIIKYILDLDHISEGFDIAQTVKEKYNQVKSLGRYKHLLSCSELLHSEKYLDILKIAADSAFVLLKSKDEESKCNALKIYEEIYSCYKKDLGKYHRNTVQIVRYIANINCDLGYNSKRDSDSLSYYQCGLMRYNFVYNAREKICEGYYVAVIYIRKRIADALYRIAYKYTKLGDSKLSSNTIDNIKEVSQHYMEALKIYKTVYTYQESNLGKEHKYTLNTENAIELTESKLSKLKSRQ